MCKPSQLFDWEAEPVQERPSEFMSVWPPQTSLPSPAPLEQAARRRQQSTHVSLTVIATFCVSVLAFCVFVLLRLATIWGR